MGKQCDQQLGSIYYVTRKAVMVHNTRAFSFQVEEGKP